MDGSNPKSGKSCNLDSDLSINGDQNNGSSLLIPVKNKKADGLIGAMKISTKSIEDWNEFMKQNRKILKLLNRKRKRSVSDSDDENASTKKTLRENVSSKKVLSANVHAVESDD